MISQGKTIEPGLKTGLPIKKVSIKPEARNIVNEDYARQLMQARRLKVWREYSGVPIKFKNIHLEDYKLKPLNAVGLSTFGIIRDTTQDMLLLGKAGTGKTHLACGKINQLLDRGVQAAYVQMIKILREIKSSWRQESFSESDIIRKYGSEIKFLVIDEIGVQFESDTEKQYLTEIINDRYNNGLVTYLISNMSLDEFTQAVGDRVIDRFRESKQLRLFEWESYRGK